MNFKTTFLSVLIGTMAAAISTGCGNFSQDPLAGKLNPGDELREPGNDQQKPRERVPSDALVIDAPDYLNYKEEVDGGPKPISGRVLIPVNRSANPKVGRDFDIEIVNLKDFKGATYDQVKGQFQWTPPKATVNDLSREMDLNVTLTTRSQPVLQREKTIKVYITRGESVPEVLSVDGLSTGRIKEGEQRNFTLRVKDIDATDAEPPKIMITSSAGRTPASISQSISVVAGTRWDPNPVRDSQDRSIWNFKMLLNLENQEVTKSSASFNFDVLALSRFGRVSAPKTTTFFIYSALSAPICSLTSSIDIVGGVQSIVSFTVQDPKGEGRIGVVFSRCASSGAQCSCTQSGWNASVQNCTMTWTPSQVSWPTDYDIVATMTNTNLSDQTMVQATCQGRVRVVRGVMRNVADDPSASDSRMTNPPAQPSSESAPVEKPRKKRVRKERRSQQ